MKTQESLFILPVIRLYLAPDELDGADSASFMAESIMKLRCMPPIGNKSIIITLLGTQALKFDPRDLYGRQALSNQAE